MLVLVLVVAASALCCAACCARTLSERRVALGAARPALRVPWPAPRVEAAADGCRGTHGRAVIQCMVVESNWPRLDELRVMFQVERGQLP